MTASVIAPVVRYGRVAIAAWSCRTAAGDAPASWRAARDGRSALVLDREWGWIGRLGDERSLFDTALEAAAAPWSAIAGGGGLPAWSISASKGDARALIERGAPALLASAPGMLGWRLAHALGAGVTVPVPVAAACSTGLYALLGAADQIESGRCERGLAGACDRALTPLLIAGFGAMGVLSGTRRPQAFAGAGTATGFAPAEGAGFAALAAEGPWRLVAGVRLGDAAHPTQFGDPRTLRACLQALWSASPEPELIVVHGTGTAAGDAYEAAALADGPWATAPRLACKPAIGHCLGASGIAELALALEAPVRRAWKIGLGFGGHLAAVAVARA